MIHSINFWLYLLLFLLTLRGLCSLLIFVAKQRSMGIDRLTRLHEKEQALNRLTKAVALLAIGIAGGIHIGYDSRNAELVSGFVFYTDVLINPPSQPNTDYDIQPARMKPIPSKICESSVDWQFGETLNDLTFEQMKGCKRVISYHRSLKGEVNVSSR